MWFSKSLRVRVTSEAAWLSSRSKCSSVQLSLQIVTSPSTARATSRTAAISCSWHAGLWRVGATTYKQSQSNESWNYKRELMTELSEVTATRRSHLGTSNKLWGGKSALGSSSNHFVLSGLVITGGSNVLGFQHKRSCCVGNSFGKSQQDIL